jgi:hypothetical protein
LAGKPSLGELESVWNRYTSDPCLSGDFPGDTVWRESHRWANRKVFETAALATLVSAMASREILVGGKAIVGRIRKCLEPLH